MAAPNRPTAWSEARRILTERGPTHYRDLAVAILDAGNVTTKGKTFPQTLSAMLARKQGEADPATARHLARVAPGVYAMTADNEQEDR